MTNFYWCTDHHRVETDDNKCPANSILGPYKTSAEAAGAISRIREREQRLSEEDAKWSGDD